MGIDLQLYRCRIGVFSGGHGTKNVTVLCDKNANVYNILSMCVVWFIGTLLIMSGIEQNPGPPGKMDMNDPEFKNWVTAAYGLKYLKSGLLSFVSNQVQQRHAELKQKVAEQNPDVKSCTECTPTNLLPDHGSGVCIQTNCFCSKASHTRRKCPNNFCSYFYDLMVTDHVEKNPRWSNTNPRQWYNKFVQYAKCFLGTHSPANLMNELDCAGLLNIVIHNCHIHQSVQDVSLFKQCRNYRNKIFHSGNYEVTDQMRTQYIDAMIRVLEDKNCLINDQQAKEMVQRLKELKTGQITITEVDIVGLVQDSIAAINELADEVKQDIERQRKQSQEDFEKRYTDAIHEIEKKKNEALCQINEAKDEREKAATYFETSSIKQDLIQIYQRDCSLLPVMPLFEHECEYLLDVYQYPSMFHADYHKDQTNKNNEQVTSFEDIFCSDGRLYRNIYITGDAGFGKTSLSKYMCLLWCQSICGPKTNSKRVLNDIDFMKTFDYVYYVTLRDTERIDVIAMIVDQLFFAQSDGRWEKMYECIENIIRQHNCLLIMDGFDEWHPKPINKKDYLFPSIIPSEKCISLTTCRAYKIENVRLPHQRIDHQVKITGIHGDSSKFFIKNVVNYLNKENSCNKNPDDFLHEIEECGLEDQLHIPIIASHLVVIWFNQKISDMSRALIYGCILDMLLERASKRKLIFPSRKTVELPVEFTKLKYLTENVSSLHKVCLLAFRSLFKHDESVSRLVFTSDQLKSEPYTLSDEDINVLCQIGILSKNKIIGQLLEQKLSFLHKSYVEFLAVLFVCLFDRDESFDKIVKQWTSINDFVQFENFFILLAGFSYQKIKFLLENIYKTISDDLTSCKRNAMLLDSSWSYTQQIKLVQTIVINCYKEVSRHNCTNIVLKLEDFIFDSSSDVNILKKLLSVNKECVQYIHSNDGLYHDEFDKVEGLQCLHISSKMPSVKFSDCMLQNSSTLHSVCIRKCTLGSEFQLPVGSLQHLTSLSLSGVKMQYSSLHNIVNVLSDNFLIENIRLSDVSCDNNQRDDRVRTLTLNLPRHTNLTSLCLEKVNILCSNANNSSLQFLRLYLFADIARRYYIDIFDCVKDSQLEHLYINGDFGLDSNTLNALTSTVKTLANIKSLELKCMNLPVLQLHPNATPVKVVMWDVKMSDQCFHSFIESLVNKQSVIKVQLRKLMLTSLEELYDIRNTMQYISEWLTSKPTVNITSNCGNWLKFKTRSSQ